MRRCILDNCLIEIVIISLRFQTKLSLLSTQVAPAEAQTKPPSSSPEKIRCRASAGITEQIRRQETILHGIGPRCVTCEGVCAHMSWSCENSRRINTYMNCSETSGLPLPSPGRKRQKKKKNADGRPRRAIQKVERSHRKQSKAQKTRRMQELPP